MLWFIIAVLVWVLLGGIGAFIAVSVKRNSPVSLPGHLEEYDDIVSYILGMVCGLISLIVAIKLPYRRRPRTKVPHNPNKRP